jgi:hypothetical protein
VRIGCENLGQVAELDPPRRVDLGGEPNRERNIRRGEWRAVMSGDPIPFVYGETVVGGERLSQ